MAIVDYKNGILNAIKAAQDSATGVFDYITGYSTGDVWLTDNQAVSWNTATTGTMDMAETDILLTIGTAAQLLGISLWSSDAFGGGLPTSADGVGVQMLVNSGSPISVQSGDVIRVVEIELGITG